MMISTGHAIELIKSYDSDNAYEASEALYEGLADFVAQWGDKTWALAALIERVPLQGHLRDHLARIGADRRLVNAAAKAPQRFLSGYHDLRVAVAEDSKAFYKALELGAFEGEHYDTTANGRGVMMTLKDVIRLRVVRPRTEHRKPFYEYWSRPERKYFTVGGGGPSDFDCFL